VGRGARRARDLGAARGVPAGDGVRRADGAARCAAARRRVRHRSVGDRPRCDGAGALLYSLGFVIATGLLHGVGILLGFAHRWSAGRLAVRIAGGGVALAGLFFLWRALA
jgi:hypothetical protein